MRNQKGITLIALIITIIVLLILAGISINLIVGEDGILSKAQQASIKQRFAQYMEELELGLYENLTVAGDEIKNYIKTISKEDCDKFIIINGKLIYIGEDIEEVGVAANLQISISDFSNGDVKEIQEIVNKVLVLGQSVNVPEDDNIVAPSELIGTRLYDKNSKNGDRWKIIIDYNEYNEEIGKYGSGFYLLESGKTYVINGKNLSLSNDYIVNYKDETIVVLTEKAVEWSLNSTLAVKEGLVLNIDPTNVSDGNWTGLTVHGDVKYDGDSRALLFNEDTNNINGEGGYLETTRTGIDFSKGFTFELYGNLSRLRYDNGNGKACMGYFCRIPSLQSNIFYSMRFGYCDDGSICKFTDSSSWSGDGNSIHTNNKGDVQLKKEIGYSINEDFYLTFVYRVYDAENINNNDEYMNINKVDKIEYYLNGNLYGYTYYGNSNYETGLSVWNKDECPFYIGVCPWYAETDNLYYLKGKIYTTRLYTVPMTEKEVKENMDMTEKYRESF